MRTCLWALLHGVFPPLPFCCEHSLFFMVDVWNIFPSSQPHYLLILPFRLGCWQYGRTVTLSSPRTLKKPTKQSSKKMNRNMSSTNKDRNSRTKAWFGHLSPWVGRRGCVFYVFLVGNIYPVTFFFKLSRNATVPFSGGNWRWVCLYLIPSIPICSWSAYIVFILRPHRE